MNIAVIGQGYVGLTAAVSLADVGHRVTGIDTDTARLSLLQRGELPFLEPSIDEPLRRPWQSGQLDSHHSLSSIPGVISVALIAVGSPELPSGDALPGPGGFARQVSSGSASGGTSSESRGLLV